MGNVLDIVKLYRYILIILYLKVSSSVNFYFLSLESCGIIDIIKKLSFSVAYFYFFMFFIFFDAYF